MATYKVWLTVKDSYGNTKEIDGGNIDVDLSTLTQDEIDQIEEALPLEEYLRKDELDVELDSYAKDEEVVQVVKDNESIKYADFFDAP